MLRRGKSKRLPDLPQPQSPSITAFESSFSGGLKKLTPDSSRKDSKVSPSPHLDDDFLTPAMSRIHHQQNPSQASLHPLMELFAFPLPEPPPISNTLRDRESAFKIPMMAQPRRFTDELVKVRLRDVVFDPAQFIHHSKLNQMNSKHTMSRAVDKDERYLQHNTTLYPKDTMKVTVHRKPTVSSGYDSDGTVETLRRNLDLNREHSQTRHLSDLQSDPHIGRNHHLVNRPGGSRPMPADDGTLTLRRRNELRLKSIQPALDPIIDERPRKSRFTDLLKAWDSKQKRKNVGEKSGHADTAATDDQRLSLGVDVHSVSWNTLSTMEKQRQSVIHELLLTERRYLQDLSVLKIVCVTATVAVLVTITRYSLILQKPC